MVRWRVWESFALPMAGMVCLPLLQTVQTVPQYKHGADTWLSCPQATFMGCPHFTPVVAFASRCCFGECPAVAATALQASRGTLRSVTSFRKVASRDSTYRLQRIRQFDIIGPWSNDTVLVNYRAI